MVLHFDEMRTAVLLQQDTRKGWVLGTYHRPSCDTGGPSTYPFEEFINPDTGEILYRHKQTVENER
ncbi:hypothetical protein ACFLQN_00865 [Candidatus Aenigmatarchaeota archaeon]